MDNKRSLIKLILILLFSIILVACSAGSGGGDDNGPGKPGPGKIGTGILPDLEPHSNSFKGDHYSGSGQCNACHQNLTDESGNDVSLGTDWASSMMANSTRDPYWLAKVAAEIERNPVLKEELDSTCSRCHAPMANDAAEKDGVEFVIHGEGGLLDSDNPYFDQTMEGVSCTLCHQMEDNGKMGTIDGVSGKFSVKEYESLSDRPAYGQYTGPSGAYMVAVSQFNPVYSEHISTSESCAACHDLRTPSVDVDGNPIGGSEDTFFPEQMVFSEWKHSDYATGGSKEKTCQGCHMPFAEGSVLLATEGGGEPRENFSRHTFLGANTVMQSMLKKYRTELGIELEAESFDESIERNREFLKTAATVNIQSSSIENSELTVNVKVTNNTGHKLPSGYPSRRAYLHMVVTNSNGEVVFESGKVNSNGSLDEIATDTNSMSYEEHYNLITSEEQVQVYEAIMGDSASGVTHTLLQATHYLKDNRLLPSGFSKLTASDDIKVVGNAANDNNFDNGGDNVIYKIPIEDATDSYNVFVELNYQPLAYGHIQDLFKSIKVKEVDEFKTMFDGTSLKTETIASDAASTS